jgi:O-antigen/teichoic acid export membrane protein
MSSTTREIGDSSSVAQPIVETGSLKQLLAGGSLLTIAMIGAGAGNYLANLIIGAVLTAAEFGDAALMVTFLLASTVLTGGTQLLAAKATAEDLSGSGSRVRELRTNSMRVGTLVAVAVLAASPVLTATFGLGSSWLIPLMALGLPAHLALSVDRGQLQGNLALVSLAKTFLAEVIVRLVATVALVGVGAGAVGATVAINVAFLGGLAVSRSALRASGVTIYNAGESTAPSAARATTTVAHVALLSAGTVLITNGDLVAAKLVLDPADAGRYALVGLVGRVVYMMAIALHGTMIPLMIRAADDRAAVKRNCLAAVGSVSLVATVGIWALDDLIVSIIGGSEYRSAAGLLGPYALAAALFTVASTSATLDLAVDRTRESWLILAGALLQSGLFAFGNPSSGQEIVIMQITSMVVLLTAILFGNKVEQAVMSSVGSKPWQVTTSTTSSF